MRKVLTIGAYPFERCALDVHLTDELACIENEHTAGIRFEAGPGSMRTYITAQDCRSLIAALQEMAESLDVLTAKIGEAA